MNMEQKATKHFVLLFVLFYLLASSSAFQLSTGNRKLMNDDASPQESVFEADAVNKKVLEQFIERRMLIELQDYPGTGANDRHNP